MWVRVIGKVGNSQMVVLPPSICRSLGWERGDYLLINVVGTNIVQMTRFVPAVMPDAVRQAMEEVPVISYDGEPPRSVA